ncbi:MAG: hypothetical protein RL264_1502 [Bacteroidota bacterium]|jgi:predicted component of viral defense system (DUF524 family)
MKIELSNIKPGLVLEIKGDVNTLFEISDQDAMQYGEAKIQLKEGCTYEYQFSDETIFFKEGSKKNAIVSFSKFGKHKGSFNPNILVGTHSLEINNSPILLPIEVRSVKSEYRSDYRFMLESITERCTDLIMQIDSPINQHFETDFNKNPETLYQRFSFVKSLIDSKEFEEAIQKIVSNPTTKWEEEHEEKDIRRIRRFNQKNIKQLVTKSNRLQISSNHFLNKSYGLTSIPTKIDSTRKTESIDTAENRFIKHSLEEFLFFCENCELKFEKYSNAKFESGLLVTKISTLLNQSFFKQISRPTSLKLNSPVLQRKSGYREVLNAWLKFDLAAKLIWNGGDNVYSAGKKDIATLYEYWLFFTLLDLLKEVFEIEPKSIEELIQYDKGQLTLNLKQGTAIALKGIYKSETRNLNIQFSYNRSFGGGKTFPKSGSYTTTLRPDYTLSIWPEEIKEAKDAEITELITHIHFDAKYKVNNFYELISKSKDEELSEEENIELINEELEEVKKGTFKNQDLLKMHAYKDAIRRTAGAYVLYPGEGKDEPFRGFHELIPGLGAFVIKPNKDDKDKEHLKNFIKKVVANFIDRASQREYTAVKIYDIHRDKKDDENLLNEPMPEYLDEAKKVKLIPDETHIIIAYYKSIDHLKWIQKRMKYNGRIGNVRGAMNLTPEFIGANYIILHSKIDPRPIVYKINQEVDYRPTVVSSSDDVFKLNSEFPEYPNPSQQFYLLFNLLEKEENFLDGTINVENLPGYDSAMKNTLPFTCTLTEFIKFSKVL